ncbi:MAG: tetratricopeptide repeat protein [Acidobacteriaceae bacterium]|nr:tetratricopeptide repeat protein [Acidobacteriaceae bacterium]
MAHDPAESKDFFISYTSADRGWAEWIAWQLDAAGYKVVLQAWDFAAGTNFISQMKAAAEAKRTIAVYSPAYFKSKFSEAEWSAAFAKGALVPVRVQPCDIPDFLRPVVYTDLVEMPEAAARERLLRAVRQTPARPVTAPPYPPGQAKAKRFPGQLPAIFAVPLPRNPNFTGRDQMLEDLHQKLNSGRSAALIQAISGMGGVGKTSLALEYCYRFASDYDLIWWLRAEQCATLAADYANLAQRLELPEKNSTNQPQIIAAVRDWLTHNSGWLLVFDNAVDVKGFDEYLPHSTTGNILITSRNPAWGNVAAPLPVQQLTRAESVRFLLQRTNRDEPEAADKLSVLLGDLPLALTHAASYIEAKDISITDYISRLQSYSKKLLEPIKGTWALSLENLRSECPNALRLLFLCVFLTPDHIPRTLLRAKLPDDLDLDDAIEALRRYGLVETTQTFISVHRLLQKVIREDLEQDAQRALATEALKMVKGQFPEQPEDFRQWPACAPLFSHALEVIKHAESLQIALPEAAALLSSAGVYQGKRGQLESGRDLMTRSLELEEQVNGPDHPNVAIRANNLADTLIALGQFDLAIQHLQRALRIDESARGPDHSFVAIRLFNLGRALLRKGDLKTSLEYAKRALEIDEKALGPCHHRVALDSDLIGIVLYHREEKDDLANALTYARRALSIDLELFGPNHVEIATHWNNIAMILALQGDLINAWNCYRKALEIYTSTLPPDHPYTQITRKNLAELLTYLRPLIMREHASLKSGDPKADVLNRLIAELDSLAPTLLP